MLILHSSTTLRCSTTIPHTDTILLQFLKSHDLQKLMHIRMIITVINYLFQIMKMFASPKYFLMAKTHFFHTSEFFEIFRRLDKSALIRPFSNLCFLLSDFNARWRHITLWVITYDVIGREMGFRQCRLIDWNCLIGSSSKLSPIRSFRFLVEQESKFQKRPRIVVAHVINIYIVSYILRNNIYILIFTNLYKIYFEPV